MLMLHMPVMLMPMLSPRTVPMICQTLSKPSTTVSTPVCGSIVTLPSSIVVITRIRIGIATQIPIRM